MSESINPFASPAFDAQAARPRDAEELRRKFLPRERAIRGLGSLYFLLGVLLIVFWHASALTVQPSKDVSVPEVYFSGMFYFGGMAAICITLGHGLRSLKKSTRIPAALIATMLSSVLIIVAVAQRTPLPLLPAAIGGYTLYVLLGRHARYVFSRYYQQIREDTAKVDPGVSIVAVVLGVLIVLAVSAYTVGVMMIHLRTPPPMHDNDKG